MKAFHITPISNLKSILKNGIQPKIGERSSQLTSEGMPLESKPRVYLFPSKEDCDTALYQWLGEEFEDLEEDLVILQVNLKGMAFEQTCDFEIAVLKTIKPVRIECIYDELWDHWMQSN